MAVHFVNEDVIIGMDAGTLALKTVALTLEGNDFDVARECHSDMASVRGMHADVKRGADQ